MNFRFDYMGVGGQEMIAQQQCELFGASDAELLGQDVNRVLLRVGGDNIRVVACSQIIWKLEREILYNLYSGSFGRCLLLLFDMVNIDKNCKWVNKSMQLRLYNKSCN